jgi:integrase
MLVEENNNKTNSFFVNGIHRKQIQNGYTPEMVKYYKESQYVRKFIRKKAVAAESSAKTYASRLMHFGVFVYKRYSRAGAHPLDDFISEIIAGKHDPYDLLAELADYLKSEQSKISPISSNQVREVVKCAKRFMKACRIPVFNEDFADLVSLPKKQRTERKPLEKIDINRFLNAADDIWLKTAIIMLASRGSRPVEACAVRNRDVNFLDGISDKEFESERFIPWITYRGEFTKMRVEITRPMPKEAARQVREWYAVKYRKHHTTLKDPKTGEIYWDWVQPEPGANDLILAHWHLNGDSPTPQGVYDTLRDKFAELVDRLGVGWQGQGDGQQQKTRRVVTLHGFRSFVKTTISDLGFRDYSEFYIGHDTSTYYRPSEKEIVDKFLKVQDYLTFLDIQALESKHADVESKLQASEERFTRLQEDMAKENKDLKQQMADMQKNFQLILQKIDVSKLE